MVRFAASMRRSNCNLIISPNCSTSSGNESHSIVGIALMTVAKKPIIRKSLRTIFSMLGCRTLMATWFDGTLDGELFSVTSTFLLILRARFGSSRSIELSSNVARCGFNFALYTCAMAPTPSGFSSNSSKMSSKRCPSKAASIVRFDVASVCAGAFEWRVDMMRHIWVGKTSVREAAHCPSYQQSVVTPSSRR
jgi:hypothetical protein